MRLDEIRLPRATYVISAFGNEFISGISKEEWRLNCRRKFLDLPFCVVQESAGLHKNGSGGRCDARMWRKATRGQSVRTYRLLGNRL